MKVQIRIGDYTFSVEGTTRHESSKRGKPIMRRGRPLGQPESSLERLFVDLSAVPGTEHLTLRGDHEEEVVSWPDGEVHFTKARIVVQSNPSVLCVESRRS